MRISELETEKIEIEESMDAILAQISRLLESVPPDTIVSARTMFIEEEDFEYGRKNNSVWLRTDDANDKSI